MNVTYWNEPISWQHRYQNDYGASEGNKRKSIEEIEKKLGGKVRSVRVDRMSSTGDSDFLHGAALVELPNER